MNPFLHSMQFSEKEMIDNVKEIHTPDKREKKIQGQKNSPTICPKYDTVTRIVTYSYSSQKFQNFTSTSKSQ